jgi:hypothetical protein
MPNLLVNSDLGGNRYGMGYKFMESRLSKAEKVKGKNYSGRILGFQKPSSQPIIARSIRVLPVLSVLSPIRDKLTPIS